MPRKPKRHPATLASKVPLTDDNPMRAHTYPGQASWAINSKDTCRECAHYETRGYYVGGALKPGSCRRAASMLTMQTPRFPHHAKACKYFERSNIEVPAYKEPIAGKR